MKYGSLSNILYDTTISTTPKVGMGVTELCYSDRHPYTIIKVLSKKRIQVTPDIAIRIDNNGCSDVQRYTYETNNNSQPITLFLNKQGNWKLLGNSKGSTYLVGLREKYYDFAR